MRITVTDGFKCEKFRDFEKIHIIIGSDRILIKKGKNELLYKLSSDNNDYRKKV